MATRRQFLHRAAGLSALAALTGCERTISFVTKNLPAPGSLPLLDGDTIDPDFHLLSRAAFGPWPGEVQRLKAMGHKAWIEEQLNPDSIDDTDCTLRARRFESLEFDPGSAYEFRKPELRNEITRHTFLRAIYSKRQLYEVMVEFWTDHLNIDLEKGDCIYFKPSDDREVVRKHALGTFESMIRASATSPAMLVYLDGRVNRVTKDKPVPNENYARELMELHTLGVNGGYCQTDVREAARCLSGWTVNLLKDKSGAFHKGVQRFSYEPRGHSFFNPEYHDNGEKTVLGQVIPAGGGESDLDRLISIVCSHPSTAKFLARKLCVRFVSYDPPPALVDRVAAAYGSRGGDIKAMLRTILSSEEFMAARGALTKRPFRFMVSALRALGADTHVHASRNGTGPLLDYLGRLGQPLFQYPTPDGYPDEQAPWLGTLLWRWNFAMDLASERMSGDVDLPLEDVEKALSLNQKTDRDERLARWWSHLIGRKPQAGELEALLATAAELASQPKSGKVNEATKKAEVLALALASPAFQHC